LRSYPGPVTGLVMTDGGNKLFWRGALYPYFCWLLFLWLLDSNKQFEMTGIIQKCSENESKLKIFLFWLCCKMWVALLHFFIIKERFEVHNKVFGRFSEWIPLIVLAVLLLLISKFFFLISWSIILIIQKKTI